MSYSGHTTFYRLPYMMRGDYLTEAEEERRARIIDHLLFVSTYGAAKAVVEDPAFTLEDADSTVCTLRLSSIGGSYVFLALVNYRLAYRVDPIELNMTQGSTYYIYVIYADGMEVNPTVCSVVASASEYDDPNHLLLATVDFTGSEAVLDTDSDKQYLTNLAAHSMDATNPHGTHLYQKDLDVTDTLALRGSPVYPVFYRQVAAPGPSLQRVLSIDGVRPVFVSAMIDSLDVGQVSVHINDDRTIVVKNSGAADTGDAKSITLRIEGEYL